MAYVQFRSFLSFEPRFYEVFHDKEVVMLLRLDFIRSFLG